MIRFITTVVFLFAFQYIQSQPQLQLIEFANGLSQPVDIANAGDKRLFVVEKRGVIRIIDENGQVQSTPFLDIDSLVRSGESERGLLGLAFHPKYAENGYFYVNYTNNSGHTQIVRFRVKQNNPNEADPNAKLSLLTINQPFSNHNGGDLAFGPDGYLYIGMGDGGSGGDPDNYAQTRSSLLGKMLRINVDKGNPYEVPADNPFVDVQGTRPEIWALGLRNPWRFSFDRVTGDLWIGDVGQGNWEEISIQPAESEGGENYGWRCYEGDANYNTNGCGPKNDYTFPVYDYVSDDANGSGCSITGGYVYRGNQFPGLQGLYIYTDYCSGRFWSLKSDGQGAWINSELLNTANNEFVTFGEDADGELYVAGISSGRIYQITDTNTTGVSDQFKFERFVVSPNPTKDLLRIEIDPVQPIGCRFRILDTAGHSIIDFEEHVGKGYSKELSLKKLPEGIYFLQVQNGKQSISKKFQKL
ncbi:MAG: PQQ-dependent sugar dehydrogenase [Saprospiraceae bacterium]|nr:PQQ-dependent sugar dehydrogenase [Saprospiraceae bacterium]